MRSLKVNLTVEDVQTKEILIVTGDLSVLQQLVSGAKIALPHVQDNDTPNLQEFITDIKAKVNFKDRNCRTLSQDLYEAYVKWCEKNGHLALSSTKMAREWERLGFTKQRINGSSYWVGIKL